MAPPVAPLSLESRMTDTTNSPDDLDTDRDAEDLDSSAAAAEDDEEAENDDSEEDSEEDDRGRRRRGR